MKGLAPPLSAAYDMHILNHEGMLLINYYSMLTIELY